MYMTEHQLVIMTQFQGIQKKGCSQTCQVPILSFPSVIGILHRNRNYVNDRIHIKKKKNRSK
jgi:hypothetical protein